MLAALAAAGCSGQDKAQAGATLDSYLADYAAGNVRAACARLTPQARAAFRIREGGVSYRGCAPAMTARLRLTGPTFPPRVSAS